MTGMAMKKMAFDHLLFRRLHSMLDENVKLVLKRLLDCATEHAVESHSEAIAEKAPFSKDQTNSQRQLTSKEVPKLPCSSSNKIWTRYPGDLPKPLEDSNCSPISTLSKKPCPMHEKNTIERLKSLKEVTSSNDKSLNQNDMAIKHFRSTRRSTLDATNSQALRFNSQSGGNYPDHVETNVLDATLGASNSSSAKPIQRTNGTKLLDQQFSPQTIVDPIKEKKWVGIQTRPGIADLMQEVKFEAFQCNGPTEKLSLSGQTTSKEVTMSGHIQSQGNNSSQRQNNISSGTERWKDGNRKISGLADQKSHMSRNNRSLSRSKDSLPTRRLGQAKAMNERRNTGTELITTLGPTLLRTASAHLHFQKDHLTQVDENDERWGSDQKSFRIGNKTSTSKSQSRQHISSPTLPVEKRFRKNARPSHDSHTQRIEEKKNAHLASPIGHLQSRPMAMVRTNSFSTSDSTWTGSSSSPTDSEDSVARRTMTRSTSPYMSSSGSIRSSSRRTSHYSMVAAPLHAGPTPHTKNTKKKTGRLQRFKNKLGLIFHHHHHHHHHHHNEEAEAGVNHTALSNPTHSFWKTLRNILHGTSKDAQRKSKQHVGRHQQEAEHGIIDGLMKHVWRSKKKSKKSGDVKKLRKMHTRKVVQKWHWWQSFYKRRGVVRQSSIRKPNVRWGFKGRRKPQLRYLKHH